MPFIKELVIHGFKSFARETRIPFKNTMNVIIGPNGSGKSNVTDAICFVLGRLGSKSMRAKRTSNLLFAGTQKYKPSAEAGVEMVFDNMDKGFSLAEKEISIKRILRRNGQSIYKINGEVKTRQEIIELLAQAGIDPNGFNIVLQGEIDSFVKMSAEERREVIEEVAGISIYEIRKQRSLTELDKTELKLKEVSATLRERHAYLRNLEEERKQALHFKKLQSDILDCRASLIHLSILEKQAAIDEINEQLKKLQAEIEKINSFVDRNNQEISVLNGKINHITNDIQKNSGIEQEKLNNEISDLRADLMGLSTRKQSCESQITEKESRKAEIAEAIARLEEEISSATKSKSGIKPGSSLKKELEEKKKRLEEIDENRRRLYELKSKQSSALSRLEDRRKQTQKTKNESDFMLTRIQEIEAELSTRDSLEQHQEALARLKTCADRLKKELAENQKDRIESEKSAAALERQVQELDKIKSKIFSLDICPLCRTKMTKEHVSHVVAETEEHRAKYKKELESLLKLISELAEKHSVFSIELENSEKELKARTSDTLKLESINEKKQSLRELSEQQKSLEAELAELEEKKASLDRQILAVKTSEESYDSLLLEIQEMKRREEKDIGMELTLKQREIERMKNVSRQAAREIEEERAEISELSEQIEAKQETLEEKNEQNEVLKRKFRKILEDKAAYQEKIRFFESDILQKQANKQVTEQKIGDLKINRAHVSAQKESAETEMAEFHEAKIIKAPLEVLTKKLEETQQAILKIGTVNLRSLEVYEGIKAEYDKIQEKSNTLLKEKEDILKVIEDIDKKKRKVFIQTLEKINELFSRNFGQLSTKGIATLEPIDKENLFESGIEMIIKVGKGKYFDTHSLSGGEKSLISLSLIFAIQEYKPYCFYIFDEIDAALDKRNSERLVALLKRYMNKGQYIIITHNDSLTTEAPALYGVVMQDKISSIFSMEI